MNERLISIGTMEGEIRLIAAKTTASAVDHALSQGDEPEAIRYLTEAVSRLIDAPTYQVIPDHILAAPAPIADQRYQTLLATAFAFAMQSRGMTPKVWMLSPKPLTKEWVWANDGASRAYKSMIRHDTPAIFLAKNILTREIDWHSR